MATTTIIPTPGRQRQEDGEEFKASLSYIVRSRLNNNKNYR
jgi:hypothetical protein